MFGYLSLTTKINLSKLCFCLIKQNLKNAHLDDAKQQLATNLFLMFSNKHYSYSIAVRTSYANKSYIDLESLAFPLSQSNTKFLSRLCNVKLLKFLVRAVTSWKTFCRRLVLIWTNAESMRIMLNYIWGEVGRIKLIVHWDSMSYNPTPWQHLNAVSTSIMGIVSTISDAGQTEQPIAGAIPCLKAN